MRRRHVIIALITLAMVFCFALTSFAAEDQQNQGSPAGVELTLDDAINSALKNSFKIQQAKLDVDRAEKVRDAAWDNHRYMLSKTWVPTEQAFMSLPGTDDDSLFQALAADRAAFIQKKTYEISQDAINIQVTQSYYDIIKKQQNLDAAKLTLEIAERAYNQAKIKNEVGMVTSTTVQAKKTELEGAKSALEFARSDLENAYRALNKIMGKDNDFRPKLVTPVEFEKLEIPSLDAEIIRAMNPDQNPYLWSKKEGYELQKYAWTYTQPEEAGKVDIDKARLSYDEARVETRKKMKELYDSLKTLEISYESATQALATAELGLKNAQALYDSGMITKDDLLNSQMAIVKAEGDLLNIKINYNLCKLTFKKPWLSFLS
ncbi:TolC family protein [Desulfallas sp. Bu1-1]|uniref:TolC family protein n=1 Tax=Desulfallas sp. Bu1-1 TaxID=2787620 RepID=UPI00189E3C6F|nr:TolC family protein [Desulfallas sp. Bu1-1]MBF7081565.1 TolC family protein [Desulfallas sp. Bu1-1]